MRRDRNGVDCKKTCTVGVAKFVKGDSGRIDFELLDVNWMNRWTGCG